MTDPLAAALAWHDAGATVLPAAADRSKRPALSWQAYQRDRPTREQVEAWFADGARAGLGLICGAASGGLEMLELEGRAVEAGALDELGEAVRAAGLADLWEQVTTGGYAEHTPSGGLHLLYRLADEPVPGNTKLARDEQGQVLAETRGEGGWVVIAPSAGTTHPTGQAWTVLFGGPERVPTITAAQRHQLHRLVRTLDRTPAPVEPAGSRLTVVRPNGEVRPGDDFEQKVDWADDLLLGGAGWKCLTGRPGGYRTWRRPGKDTPGISATTGRAGDRERLYVFSSSTPFDIEVSITKFRAYSVLHHAGRDDDAARALRRFGYGTPAPLAPNPVEHWVAEIGRPGADPLPRRIAAVDGTSARVLAEPAPGPEAYGETEDGMARALVAIHGANLRYCPQRGKWLGWDGARWAWDDAEYHRELIRMMARTLPDERGWVMFKKRAMSAAGVGAIERLARSDPKVVVHFHQLDADPWILNTPAGIIDLRTGQLRDPDPAALCTRATACAPDPQADASRWLDFLAVTFQGDQELVEYLQRLVGYSAVGSVGPHVLPFAFGSGGNGKGVFLEAAASVLGDYATSAPVGFLMAHAHAGHETEIARLAGARMVLCSEVNEGDRFDEAKVKQLTGGDTITARFMRQNHFSFTPTHQLWLIGNTRPEVRTGGRSFWRRLRLIPFEHEVPKEQIVDDLQGILVREHGPAILAWIAAGAAAFAAGGLDEPERVKVATGEYESEQDTLMRFVDECCLIGGGDHVTIKVARVREAYEKWCHAGGETPMSATGLGLALKNRFGVKPTKGGKGVRLYAGLSLLADDENSPPNPPPNPPPFHDLGGAL